MRSPTRAPVCVLRDVTAWVRDGATRFINPPSFVFAVKFVFVFVFVLDFIFSARSAVARAASSIPKIAPRVPPMSSTASITAYRMWKIEPLAVVLGWERRDSMAVHCEEGRGGELAFVLGGGIGRVIEMRKEVLKY